MLFTAKKELSIFTFSTTVLIFHEKMCKIIDTRSNRFRNGLQQSRPTFMNKYRQDFDI